MSADSDAPGGTDRDLIAGAASRLAAEADAVAAGLAERVHPELDGFPRHASVTLSTTRAIRALVVRFAELVPRTDSTELAPLPPAAVDYVHDHVHHGIDLSVVLRAYRLGHEELWNRWIALVDEMATGDAARVRVRDASGEAMFAYIDDVTERVIDEYREERERWARSAVARRADTVRALLAGEDVDLDAASRTLRLDLSGTLVGAVLWATGAAADAVRGGDREAASPRELERAAGALAERLGGGRPLTVPAGRRTLWAWFHPAAARGRAAPPTAERERATTSRVAAAVGEPGSGAAGFRRSHREAIAARRVLRPRTLRAGSGVPPAGPDAAPPLARWSDVAAAGLLGAEEDLAIAFAERELGDLGAVDEDVATLRRTLLAHLDGGAHAARTAAALAVHANTVGNRLRRCGELLGRPLDERPLELHAALRVRATLDGEPHVA